MSPKNLSYFIDLQNFPIDEPQSSKYQQIIKEAQEALEFDGCYVLPSIINKEAIHEMREESTKIESLAHYTSNKVNVYFSKDDPTYQKITHDVFLWNEATGLYLEINFQKILLLKSYTIQKNLKTLLLIV